MSTDRKPRILVICDFYLPGYKSGGSMRTVVNMIERLSDEFDFHVITRDHDGNTDKTPYENVRIDEWNQIDPARVHYLSRSKITLSNLNNAIREVDPDAIYMNSYFSWLTVYTLILRRLGKIRDVPIIIAPEGELAASALKVRRSRKLLFVQLSSLIGLHNNVIWKFASEHEVADADRFCGSGGKFFVAPNMPPRSILPDHESFHKLEKMPGHVRFVYLSRIHPVKNLKFVLDLLMDSDGNVDLEVYGPDDSSDYLQACKNAAAQLPENVSVTFHGQVEYQHVAHTMVGGHFFVLPTQGENFGHVFIEALSAGCPLVISDRTPWTGLAEKEIGWDISLERPDEWKRVIRRCVDMDSAEYIKLSANARNFAQAWLSDRSVEDATRAVLEHGVGLASDGS
jgi:glycosyltransferase involved in cell wall biosynthesis